MGLYENMKAEPVKKMNLREPVVVKADDSVRDVILAMREKDLGCAILVDEDRRPTGMFTEGILTQLVATKPEALDQPVGDHAAQRWPQITMTDPVVAVLEALEMKNIRFLAVVDEEGRIAGLAGQKGLMEYIADHFPGQVMVQRVGQKMYMHDREGA